MLIANLKIFWIAQFQLHRDFGKTTLPKGGVETTQLTFTCSKSTIEILKKV